MNSNVYESVNYGANDLGSMCFNSLIQEQPKENVIISPLSISLLLHLAALGASKETRREMLFQLGFEFEESLPSGNQLAGACNFLQSILQTADPKVQLSLANAVFHKRGINLLPSYEKLAKSGFDAELAELKSAAQANQWVSEKTHNKIEKILDELPSSVVALLLNALYMKGDWLRTFEKHRTQEQGFRMATGEQTKVQMMMDKGDFKYLNSDGVEIIRLPLGSSPWEKKSDTSNLEFCVYIILPHWRRCGNDKTQVIDWMVPANLLHLASRMEEGYGKLLLPRFEVGFETSLKGVLASAGMTEAFSGSADFSQMFANPHGVFISDIIHKTYVKVDETGFEGAAVTGAVFEKTSMPVDSFDFTMEVNRPFAFYVCAEQERPYGKGTRLHQTQLFAGRITNPNNK